MNRQRRTTREYGEQDGEQDSGKDGDEDGAAALAELLSTLGVHEDDRESLQDGGQGRGHGKDGEGGRHQRVHHAVERHRDRVRARGRRAVVDRVGPILPIAHFGAHL